MLIGKESLFDRLYKKFGSSVRLITINYDQPRE